MSLIKSLKKLKLKKLQPGKIIVAAAMMPRRKSRVRPALPPRLPLRPLVVPRLLVPRLLPRLLRLRAQVLLRPAQRLAQKLVACRPILSSWRPCSRLCLWSRRRPSTWPSRNSCSRLRLRVLQVQALVVLRLRAQVLLRRCRLRCAGVRGRAATRRR
jgi:hypothetical protein